MKKAFLVSLLLALGCVWSSQAVVIHWSTDGYDGLSGATSAVLVYVSDGSNPVYTDGVLTTGTAVSGTVSGLALTPAGVGEQSTTTATPSQGAYFVLLFNDNNQYAYSTALAWNDTSWGAYTVDELAPATGVFAPDTFSDWTAVPEPSTALLLVIGAAAAALRRKQRA